MKISSFMRLFAACSLVSVLSWWANLGVSGTAPTDPHPDLVAALQALGPHPSLGDQADVFGRFVGIWVGEYSEFSKDGKATHSSGEWIFGWVMDGRAIQELFIIHPSAARLEMIGSCCNGKIRMAGKLVGRSTIYGPILGFFAMRSPATAATPGGCGRKIT
jgi:hypothetical protein